MYKILVFSMTRVTGFTLIEMLVVLVLISLTMSLVGPPMIDFFGKQNIDIELRTFEKEMQLLTAVAQSAEQKLAIELSGNELSVRNIKGELIYSSVKDSLQFAPQSYHVLNTGIIDQTEFKYLKNDQYQTFSIENW